MEATMRIKINAEIRDPVNKASDYAKICGYTKQEIKETYIEALKAFLSYLSDDLCEYALNVEIED
jgi:hypothetical protein